MQFSRQDSWVFAASFARVVTDILKSCQSCCIWCSSGCGGGDVSFV